MVLGNWRRRRTAASLVAAAGLMAAIFAGQTAGAMQPIAGDPVQTTGGLLSGTRLPSGVKAYLGIPFARPPVGDLRWRPPEPLRWPGIWNADRKGPECIQVLRPHDINHYFGEEPTGEDCLYMNIWVPPDAKAGDRLPVVVFIYGGGGTIGSSGLANYGGENFARRGAIFVNFNYRVGLLGFMAHPGLTKEQGGHSGDYGYLDQSAALRWVHDNIASFGGDPGKVVITGQSFGAGSVAAQMASPLSKGLFRGAMMSSACGLTDRGMIGSLEPLAEAEKVGLEVQRRLGAADLDALRNVPADRILAQQAESQLGAHVQGVRAPPVIDGYFLPAPKERLIASHAGSDVPFIASSNGDDLDSNMSPLTKAHTVAEYDAIARSMYGTASGEFLKLFPVRTDADVPPMAHRAAIEAGFLASSRRCAELQARYGRSAAYIDLFTHKHPYAPGVTFADQDPKTVGAYHTADVPYWFDTLDSYNSLRPTRVWTRYDRELADRMTGALIALAETGSPSTAAQPWPAWTQSSPRYLEFGDEVSVRIMDLKRMDWLAAHPVDAAARAAAPRGPRD
jgi:para-nitrobenzyl esterase